MKKCISCKSEKAKSEFYKSKKTTDGLRGTCKACMSAQAKERSLKPKKSAPFKTCRVCGNEMDSKMFNKNKANPDGLNNMCKACHSAKSREYVLKNHEEVTIKKREYHKRKKNDTHYISVRKRYARRYNSQPQIKLLKNLRRQLWGFIKNNQDAKLLKSLIGIDYNGFKEYIESKFYGDMTWESYGKTWQIDHKIPCSSFDLFNDDELKECWHYTNMQPLTEFDNASKGCRAVT